MGTMKKGILVLDPRTKILLLLGINIYVFTNSYVWAEIIVMAALIILLLLCGVYKAALKSAVTYIALLAIKYFLLPFCPEIILTSLNIVVITFRKLLPCVTLATLLVQTTPIRLLMHALQRWHLPQTVIIPLEQRLVTVRSQIIPLTVKEFEIFALLILNPKRVFTYEMLLDLVWHEDYSYYSRKAINNHISNLRKKLRVAPDLPDYVKSVYGVGYKFEV